jgi:hypothetical protein
MWDWALTSSLNVQNFIVSNVENIPSFFSFNWWIRDQDCVVKILVDILLKKYSKLIDLAI